MVTRSHLTDCLAKSSGHSPFDKNPAYNNHLHFSEVALEPLTQASGLILALTQLPDRIQIRLGGKP